jgi:GrpB-like predicted nucleotidyltransferase (UPF0157 family)
VLHPSLRAAVVVSDYDSEWPALFERIARRVRRALDGLGADVEHVGSKAVPGLPRSPSSTSTSWYPAREDVPAAIERLRELGYVYQGDKGIVGRDAFMWPPGAAPHHLYVVVAGSKPHADHVVFRDYLRDHPEVAQEYASLKKELADRHSSDRARYTEAKSHFIAAVLNAARA